MKNCLSRGNFDDKIKDNYEKGVVTSLREV